MEKRYTFGGFVFGESKSFQLSFKMMKESGIGYTAEFAIELTPEERQELITLLITANDKDNN